MKKTLRALLLCFLWALTALLFVSWLFDRKADPGPERQVVILTDGCPADTAALEKALLFDLPAGTEYIRVRTFDYSFFDTQTGLPEADLYILPESEAAEFPDILIPLCTLYDARAGEGLLTRYLSYTQGGAAGESYALYGRTRPLGQTHAEAVRAVAERLEAL